MRICRNCGGSDYSPSGECRSCKKLKNAAWRAANKGKALAASAGWKEKNKDRAKAYDAAWRNENGERQKVAIRRWHASNPDARKLAEHKRRAKIKGVGGKLSRGIASKLYQLQRGLCPCCREPLGENYHLDHIVPLALGGQNEDVNMQLLRQSCNNKKHAKHPVDFMQERGFLL